ncbi:MAG TPA: aldo/keto reductase [Bacteroidales bacterium]|nr:aldo/keto reductase [Bacteroidales bacterium]
MKTPFTRRRFLQTAAISSTAAMIPVLKSCSSPQSAVNELLPEGQLPQRRLGRTNRMVSCLGFGGGSQWCNWPVKDELLQNHIDHAIALGITYFDTARSYGNGLSETRYGKFLTPKYRNQIFLNSKTGDRTYDGVMKDIETTLGLLKTDHLDNYCMHSIDKIEDVDTLLSSTGGYKAFLKLRDQGVVKNIGFSYHKWNDASQKAFKEFDIDIIMCPMNATRSNGNEDNMVPLALKRDLGIIAIKIMGQNVLIGNVSGDDLLRYAMTLPVAVLNVGMDNFASLESCTEVVRQPVISEAEAIRIQQKLNFDPAVIKLPYFTG